MSSHSGSPYHSDFNDDDDDGYNSSSTTEDREEPYSIPRQVPISALQGFRNKLFPKFLLELEEQSRQISHSTQLRVAPNAPVALTMQIPSSLVAHNLQFRWWLMQSAPFIAGFVVTNKTISASKEAELETKLGVKWKRFAMNGIPSHRLIYYGWQQGHHGSDSQPEFHEYPFEVCISITSTDLSNNVDHDKLLESVRRDPRSQVWTIPAIVVLATNDLLKALPMSEGMSYFAATLATAMELWRKVEPDPEKRKEEWIVVVKALRKTNGGPSLLESDFDGRVKEEFAPARASFGARRRSRNGACRNHPFSPTQSQRSQITMSPKRARRRSRSPAHSLAKSRFTPQPRSIF
ncbi:hypothetical protein JCM5353_005637 [Sporobolomyces roseus]